MLGLQGSTLAALGVKRSQGGHRGGHCVLQGFRRPCWRCRERLGGSKHFAGGEEGALGVHNHCRGGEEESCFWGAWVQTARGWGGSWLCWKGLEMLGGPG